MALIMSNLFKIAELVLNSQWFPVLVRAACEIEGVTYNKEMLRTVAMDTLLLTNIDWDHTESMDEALLRVAADPVKAPQLDTRIRNVVKQ